MWERRSLTRREVLRLGLVAGAATAAAACVPGSSGTAPVTGKSGGTLVFGQGAGPLNLDPVGPGQNTPVWGYFRQMYDPLVWIDEKDQYVPSLATSWQNIDPKTLELKLRQGVKFHNGEPFDAKSVKFTLDRIMDPNQKATHAIRFLDVDGVEIVDPFTVRIHTKTPSATLLHGLFLAPMIPPLYTTADPEKALQNPVGTGPFKFVEWVQGDHMTMAANDDYFLGRPNLDRLVFRVIPDDAARLAALKSGEIHVNMNLPLDALEDVQSDPNLAIASTFMKQVQYIDLDETRGGPTTDVRVRQALNYAIDKDSICKTLLKGTHRTAPGQVLTEGVLGFNPDLKAYPYDPAKARRLLAEAGFPNGFDTTIYGPIGKYPADRELTPAFANQLAQVGVRAKPEQMETALYFQKKLKGELTPMFYIRADSMGDPHLSLIWSTSKATAGIYHLDKKFDDMVYAGAATIDNKEREKLYRDVTQYMYDQAMFIFLFQPAVYYGVSKKVQGFTPRGDELQHFHKVSLS